MKRRMFLSGIVALTTVSVVAPTLPAKATPIFPIYEVVWATTNHHPEANDDTSKLEIKNYPGWPVGTRFYRTGEFRDSTVGFEVEKQIRVDTGEIRYQISIKNPEILKLSFYSDDPCSLNWWRRVN